MTAKTKLRLAYTFLIFCIAMLVFAGAVDARTSSTDIENGDLVFINEENLNVSAILASGDYNELRTIDGTRKISLINGIIPTVLAISGDGYPYEFYAYNSSKPSGSQYGSGKILVSDLKSLVNGIYIRKNVSSGTSELNANNAKIINTEEIQYYVQIKNAYNTVFTKFQTDIANIITNWYEFGYEADGSGYYSTTVKNMTGYTQKLMGSNPTSYIDSARFKFSANGMRTGSHGVALRFKLNLPTIPQSSNQPVITASHDVGESGTDDFTISVSSTTINPGDTGVTITIHGLALYTYTISLYPESYLTFPSDISTSSGTIVRNSAWNLTATIGDAGNDIVYPITIDENATKGEYRVVMNDIYGNSKSVKITINSIEHIPSITIPSHVENGNLASGDSFKITLKYDHPKTGELVNLYLRNGVGTETLLRSGISFDDGSEYTYTLSTRGFDKGSYSLIARATYGGTARVSFYLAEPTLVVLSNIPDSHTLTLDKDLEITYTARGSPDALIQYIFGTNLRKAEKIPLMPDSTDADSSDAQLRSGTIVLTKEDLAKYDDGTYYLLFVHPGSDNTFTLTPQYDANGNCISVVTQSGETIGIQNRQGANAVAAILDNLQNGNSDDLSVLQTFDISKNGYIHINDLKNMMVGDYTMTFEGTTSAPEGKIVNLLISPISFEPEKVSNTAMRMKAGYTATLQENADSSERTFTISGISINTWYPGTYMAEFTIDDPKLTKAVSFVINANGTVTSSDVNITETADETYLYTGPTPTPSPSLVPTVIETSIPAPTSTPKPTASRKSPAPVIGSIAGFIAIAFMLRRK